MAQEAPVDSPKSKLKNNKKKAEQLSEAPVKSTTAKCNLCLLTITLQTKFVHTENNSWRAAWPAGPAVKAAKVELVEPGLATTSNQNGNATLDATNLSSGRYTLKLTPAPDNTWDAARRNDYTSDKALTPRYKPVRLSVQISREGTSLKVEKVEVADDGVHPPNEALSLRVKARISGSNSVLVDWRPAWIASPNKKARSSNVSMVLVHKTGSHFGPALNEFMNQKSRKSAHYLIETDGYVVNLVAETERAGHAGHSWWNKVKDLNQISIGIEIANAGGPFTDQQYSTLIQLLKDLMRRHPGVTRHRILAHSDIRVDEDNLALSSDRGVCPGPDFEWPRLMREKLSSTPNESLYGEERINSDYGSFFKDKPQGKLSPGEKDKNLVRKENMVPYGVIKALQIDLRTIGYSINARDGETATEVFDSATQTAVDRFRRHFMSGLIKVTNNLDPTFDRATAIALRRVVLDRQNP